MTTTGDRGAQVNLGFEPGSMNALNRLSVASTSTHTAGFPNGAYDDTVDGFSNPYSFIPEQEPTNKGREHNDGYEMPIELIRHYQETQTKEKQRKVAGMRRPKRLLDSWFNRVIICFILLLSVATILLVLLLMLGKVGAKCSSCDDGVLESSPEAQISDQPAAVVDLSSLEEITQRLDAQYNATLNHVEENKAKLEDIKETHETNQSELSDALLKLNSTARQNPSVFFILSTLSSTFAVQVQVKESQLTKVSEDTQDKINQMNSTLSARLQVKLEEPGPQGPQGRNGSQGPQGPEGAQGDKGPEGHNGTQGQEGPSGAMGDRGPNGVNGTQGEQGIKGLLGDKGNNGSVGDSGPAGLEGQTGVGNFSWCEHLTENGAVSVQVVETSDHRIFWVQCSTDSSGSESNLDSETSGGGFQQYTCSCRKRTGSNPECKLDYWKCPIAAP